VRVFTTGNDKLSAATNLYPFSCLRVAIPFAFIKSYNIKFLLALLSINTVIYIFPIIIGVLKTPLLKAILSSSRSSLLTTRLTSFLLSRYTSLRG
jgi:hypothetical protein